MSVDAQEPIICDEAFVLALSKLLLNSWSAEYALRITPVVRDEEYLKNALEWTFPQAYYSALFGARAVLYCYGNRMSTEHLITVAMDELAEMGLYENDCLVKNAFAEFLPFRIQSGKAFPIPEGMSLEVFHKQLVEKVTCISRAHERFIRAHIGEIAFRQIIDKTPIYLRTEFVDQRYRDLTPSVSHD